MSRLILNTVVAQRNIDVDRDIFNTFAGYCLQYHVIPDRLYLTDPSLASHTAVVLVDISNRNLNADHRAMIQLAFYHPLHTSPLLITTSRDFDYIHYAVSDSEEWGEFLFDDTTEIPDNQPVNYFKRLTEAYPTFTRLSDELAKERVSQFTLPLETVYIG